MGLNKSKGNMYPFVDYTYNVIKGKCPHDCSYCYMKRYPQPELHFDEKELKTNLGSGNTIFVGSSCDMWAECSNGRIPSRQIADILNHCIWYEAGNTFLFQSKNPARFHSWDFPKKVILGTTIETNRVYQNIMGYSPEPHYRKIDLQEMEYPKMVSIEPIMDFDLQIMVNWIQNLMPMFVSIGADSGNNHLPEPEPEKVKALIEALKEITEVKIKANLTRLLRYSKTGVS